MKNDEYYPTFYDKITHLCYSVIKNHLFLDGNKRTALVLSSYFLRINGYDYVIPNFMKYMEDIVVMVAMGTITKNLLKEIITTLIKSGELLESVKILTNENI